MTKYFTARAIVRTELSFQVAALTEAAARELAIDEARSRTIGQVSDLRLEYDGECEFCEGARVSHFIFGSGTLVRLLNLSGPSEDTTFDATIRFDDGAERQLALPLSREKLRLL
jgi:hypothetical protein